VALFRSRLERRLWLAAGGLQAAIFLSLAWVRPVSAALRDLGLLRGAMIGAFLAVAAGAGWALARTRPGGREVAVLLPFAGFYLAVLATMERAEEAFHFVEYGALGGLVYGALAARRAAAPFSPAGAGAPGAAEPPLRAPGLGLRALAPPALGAALLTALAGWVDEGIQHLLPTRYYDLRDVGFNALAGVVAVGALTAWRLVRRR
jgi:hypothetical protein